MPLGIGAEVCAPLEMGAGVCAPLVIGAGVPFVIGVETPFVAGGAGVEFPSIAAGCAGCDVIPWSVGEAVEWKRGCKATPAYSSSCCRI